MKNNSNGVVEMKFYDYVIYEKYKFIARNDVDPDVLYVSERLRCHLIQEHQMKFNNETGKEFFSGCEVRVDRDIPGISFGFSKINEVFIVEDNDLNDMSIYRKEYDDK